MHEEQREISNSIVKSIKLKFSTAPLSLSLSLSLARAHTHTHTHTVQRSPGVHAAVPSEARRRMVIWHGDGRRGGEPGIYSDGYG